ncbi:chromosome segregation protein SMC [Thioflexithrix psekupsensis]|uniref:Chromosome partition protein Smc n=1 Tax=Thioflexithrix psekupsensis TaxID=1570016 RepID=A0A251X5F0_9GAMM|nr:chromosome segregation protein SMC [Thioflexithrix psekupsensis]OUD12338.1 chromosome segregation protein SMC [Thioflexithrix psekupsensis]
MRLSKIKLNGFKSFVEPTTLHFPSNRVGVVGPNGCGKSNVIDAVRWVMGEISAKNLRGGAMIDVIFNGSGTRKPADEAAVELIFSHANLPQFPDLSEISVKREINRNAQSTYYLNGIKCRRKDIMDLFLGTGLGPKSYAIIEQGMISRMIEAKPEELRLFLEEAAGIAKYKERRKETEQKMQQTRDNLARLNELQQELQKQLDKLQKQAKEAERFQQLKVTEQRLKAELLAMKWLAQDTIVQEKQHFIQQYAEKLQDDLLALDQLEDEHQQQRERRQQAQQHLEVVQEKYHHLQREISRLEQAIEHGNERHEQLRWDIEQAEETRAKTQQELQQDEEQVDDLIKKIENSSRQLSQYQAAEEQAESVLQQAETAWQIWQQQWDAFNERAQEPTRRAEVQRTHLQHLEQRLEQHRQRLQKVEAERQQIDTAGVQTALAALEAEIGEIQHAQHAAEQALLNYQNEVNVLRENIQTQSAKHHHDNTQVQRLTGLLSSLEALQNAALDRQNSDLSAWLSVNRLDNAPRLTQRLQVATGWERAVELVLGDRLQALCVQTLEEWQNALNTPPQGDLVLLSAQNNPALLPNSATLPLTPLSDKIKSPVELTDVLAGVWTAADLAEAQRYRSQLAAHESIVTAQGIWLGRNWLHSRQVVDPKASILAREREINQLAQQLTQLDQQVLTQTQALEQQRGQLRDNEALRDETQRQVNELQQQLSQIRSQHGGRQARLEHLHAQSQRLHEEKEELLQYIAEEGEELMHTRDTLHLALAEMEQFADERDQLTQQRQQLQEAVLQARQQHQQIKGECHQIDVQLQTFKTEQIRVDQAISRLETRIEELTDQLHDLQHTLRRQVDPLGTLTQELENYQEQHAQLEEQLTQARQTITHLDQHIEEYEIKRRQLSANTLELRNQLEQAKMEAQSSEVRRQTFAEQLAEIRLPLTEETTDLAKNTEPQSPELTTELGEILENISVEPKEQFYTPSAIVLLSQLPEHADEESWQAQIDAVARKLDRIGSVNLAALNEFSEQEARKHYLDTQSADLESALDMLTNAINKIDRETRQRFKATLETVNQNMQLMFPRLFGGGEARLELVGDDLLKAGVTIMARPPGKRNSTIHLLSGGEKALTAIALVFGIFELNPAPFCMLDEVDAPLDDTNVGRFCALVSSMSERLQFIFITHNKITMEIADQLIGVTQQELGVSRPVSVDIATAVDMVA